MQNENGILFTEFFFKRVDAIHIFYLEDYYDYEKMYLGSSCYDGLLLLL